jgi:hypothetical protein
VPESAEKPRITAVHVDDAVIIRVEATPAVLPPDELVSFPFGLERSAASALVRKGTLPAAKIGRRLYARRSEVLGLVDTLTKGRGSGPAAGASYAELVAAAKGRTAR